MKSLAIPEINFLGKSKYAIILSVAIVAISIFSLVTQGLKFGIDFTGGTLIEVGYQNPVNLDDVRDRLSKENFNGANVQYFGSTNEILIRLEPQGASSAKISSNIIRLLGDNIDIRRVEFVGPKVGEELTNDGGLAMLYALIGILIYVAFRFEYRFALGSISALIHDVIITLGIFSLLQIEFDLTVLAAILAVIGYSLNDTIVIFDRIRENFRLLRKTETLTILNKSINQTISRTVITSGTTLLVLSALYFIGGKSLEGFSLALIIGVIIGTYSSIYVATTSVFLMDVSTSDLLQVKKEQIDDGMP